MIQNKENELKKERILKKEMNHDIEEMLIATFDTSLVLPSSKRGTSGSASSSSNDDTPSSTIQSNKSSSSNDSDIETGLSHAINLSQQKCRLLDAKEDSFSFPHYSPIPVIDMSCLSKEPQQRICCIFEEGTSAFTSHISLLLDENISQNHDGLLRVVEEDNACTIASSIQEMYSFKMITASLLFNKGIDKIHDYDYSAAKSYFQQALDLLDEVKLHVLDSVNASATASCMKQNILATHTLMNSITLLNLGHVCWHLSDPDDSIRSYQQCLEGLKGIKLLDEVGDYEVRFHGRHIMAACLNCIGMAFLNERVLPCQAEHDTNKLLSQAKICIKYLEASLAIYEDYKRTDDICLDNISMMTFKANMATTLNNLGRVYYIINDYPQALHYQGACLQERSACLPSTHLDLSVAHFNVAQSLAALDENEEALDHYHFFLSDATPILGHDHAVIIGAVITITDLYIDMENYDGAEDLLREYLSSSAYVSTESLHSKLTLLNSLSAVLNYQNKLEGALETLTQACNIILPLPQDTSTVKSYITNCCNIAVILSKDHNIENAVIMFNKALAKIESFENQTQFSKLLIEIHMNMSSIYESVGSYSVCIIHLEKTVAIAKEFFGPMDSHVSTYLNQLGLMYYKEQEYQTALSAFIECLHIHTHCEKNNISQIVAVLYNAATVYKAMGMTSEALTIYHNVLIHERQNMKEQESTSKPKDLIHTLRHIFQIYKEQGVPKNGLKYLLEAVDVCRQYKDSIDTGLGRSTFFLIGEYLMLTREVKDGFKYYCEGCELFGGVDDETLYAGGENGLRIVLAHLCTNEKIFPLHAAAA